MNKRIARLSQIVASMGILALTLTGCYFADGTMSMQGDDGDLRIEFDLKQGVETALFDPEESAREYVQSRFGSPWRYESSYESFPYTVVEFGQSARVTKNGVAHRFKDKHDNEISVQWTGTEYRLEFSVSVIEPFDNSNLDPQVTFAWIAPEGWRTAIRSVGNGSAIVTRSGVAWYGETGGNDVVVIGLQPPQVRMLPTPEPQAEEEQPGQEPEPQAEEEQPGQEPEAEANVPAPGNEASPEPEREGEEESPPTEEGEGGNEATSETTEAGETLPETSESSTSDLIGSEGVAATKVSGEPGLVEVDSEFFPAIAINSEEIRAGAEIRVIGIFAEGVLVEPLSRQDSGFNLWVVGGIFGALVLVMGGIVLLVLRKKASAQQEHASDT